MKAKDLIAAFSDDRYKHDENHVVVATRSGCQYAVHMDPIEIATDDFQSDDGYIYGTRLNGRISMKGRRRVDTREETRWFMISNIHLVASE